MKPLFAIIGCGRIGRRHAEQLIKVGRLAAVCDIVYENAAELAEKYGANLYLSIEELLENEPRRRDCKRVHTQWPSCGTQH